MLDSPHPATETLNEYLDGAFDSNARIALEAHLAGCAHCTAQLAQLRALFARLESLPDLPLARDLAPEVLAALGRLSPAATVPAWLRLGLAAQAVLAAVLLVAAWPLAAQLVPSAEPPGVTNVARSIENTLAAWLHGAQTAAVTANDWLLQARAWLRPAPLALEGQWLPIGIGLGALLALWLLGNGLLLRVGPDSLTRRSS